MRVAAPAPVAAAVVGAALACWLVALGRMGGMDMGPGTDLGSLPFFTGIWTTMMAAMMLPSALPMILLFQRVGAERRTRGRAAPSTGVFVSAYLFLWVAVGAVAFGVDRALEAASPGFLAWDAQGPLVAGLAVAAAGLYELTPLKRTCLDHCRGPLHFVLGGWRPGARGAIRMGLEHGVFCAGCCWGLMLILFAVGIMSLTWMVAVAACVFVQKVLPFGGRTRAPLALALVALGAWIAIAPGSVPALTPPGAPMM
ncbi:MAG TPA: DUF2182 domain-containing protein [Gaiellaceae bacterium]|jgi:predicted metal-binding membrane protein|nr:DUF2182 domain-containing protein [Gaiellaceae bacterium]